MSERIELTPAERAVAMQALRDQNAVGTLVDALLDAVNQVRAGGDPVGTIRRSPSGNVMVLTESGWFWIHRNGDHADSGTPIPSEWPVIYSPEAS